MVKFNDDGQGYFEFVFKHASAKFWDMVEKALNKGHAGVNKIISAEKKGSIFEVVISHDDVGFTFLTQIKHPFDDDDDDDKNVYYDNFLMINQINAVIDYLAGDNVD